MSSLEKLEALLSQQFELDLKEPVKEESKQEIESEIESIASTVSHKCKSPAPPASKVVEVVYQDPASKRNAPSNTDFRSFMSSKIKGSKSNLLTLVRKPSRKDNETERENSQKDKDLNELLEASKLVQEFNVGRLQGKDRRDYMKKRLVELGGKGELSAAKKAPKPIRLGMERKQVYRAEKKLQEAKDMGMYHSRTRHIYEDPILKKKSDSKRKWDQRGGIDKPKVGKFKQGVLYVAKRDIEKNSGKFSSGSSVNKRKLGSVSGKAGKMVGLGSSGGFKKRKK